MTAAALVAPAGLKAAAALPDILEMGVMAAPAVTVLMVSAAAAAAVRTALFPETFAAVLAAAWGCWGRERTGLAGLGATQ